MNQKDLIWLLCGALLTTTPAFAQSKAPPSPGNAPPAETIVPSPHSSGFTLEDAVAKAMAHSPRLKAFNSAVAAARSEQLQAGLWQNPEINYSRENVGGGAAYKAISPQQDSYGVSQVIEIGGKIAARESIAGKGSEIAALDYQAAALDVIRDVTAAYAAAVAAEENVRLAEEQKALAEDVLKSVGIRVKAAAAPLIQKRRAEVEQGTATVVLDKAIRDRDIAREQLAAVMGELHFDFVLDRVSFYDIATPEPANDEKTRETQLQANPDLVRLNSGLEQARARLQLEQANAIPDPRVNVGLIDIPSARDQAFVVGLSLPIPVFNANRGNIGKARHDVIRTEMDNRQTILNVSAALTEAYERMENAYVQAKTLKAEILPSAEDAFQLAREGYGLGRFPYLEVLDAQRSLFTVKQQQIEAIRAFHTARAQVERLTAAHLTDIDSTGDHHAE